MAIKSLNKVLSFDRFTVTINFPSGNRCCKLCPLMHGMDRKQCARTGEYIANADGIGYNCPLVQIPEELKENTIEKEEDLYGND